MEPNSFSLPYSDYKKQPKLIDQVRHAIRVKHYRYYTEKAYVFRIKEFIKYHKKRHPAEMAEREVQKYLAWLAIAQHVSSSTQNQALSL